MPTLRFPFPRLALSRPFPSFERLGRFAVTALGCYAADRLSAGVLPSTGAVYWLSTGIALAALLRWGLKLWMACAVADIAAVLALGTPSLLALAAAAGHTASVAATAWGLKRLDTHTSLERSKDVWWFCLFGLGVAPLLAAGNGAFWLSLASAGSRYGTGTFLHAWWTHAAGVLVLGVPLITLTHRTFHQAFAEDRRLGSLLLILATVCSGLLSWSLSVGGGISPFVLLPQLLLCWLVVRSGLFAASLATLLLVGIAAATNAIGPAILPIATDGNAVLWSQACMLMALPLLLAGFVADQRVAEERRQLTSKLFDHLQEGVLITDADHRVIDANPRFAAITGFSREEMLGTVPALMRPAPSHAVTPDQHAEMRARLAAEGAWCGEIAAQRRDGTACTLDVTVSAVHAPSGEIRFHAVAVADVTEARAQRERLERQAHTDELTGLPNRARLAHMLRESMQASEHDGFLLIVCYLDLDHFKPVNDRFGHETGDRLLIELAQRLRRSLRQWASGNDTVARLGGDEFVLLLRTATIEEGRHAVERVMRNVCQPYELDGDVGSISVTASLGATVYPMDKADADTLLRHADHAMYGAKQAGRNGYLFFDAEHDRRTEQHFEALGRVQSAMDADQFTLFYQPKVDMRHGRVLGMEALLRWKHPEHGVIAPSQFLPLIESTGLSARLGDWVLQQGVEQLARWQRMGLDMTVSINISARHLQEPLFAKRLAGLLAGHTTPVGQRLIIEVLETAALADVDYTCALMQECRALGVRFALDDFGTGYSTFTYLKRLPLDFLKIDRSFVQTMLTDRQDLAIVEGVIGLSETFGCTVVAEGVESAEQAIRLIELGCDVGQGNGIACAMPMDNVYAWVSGYRNPFASLQKTPAV